MKFGLSISAPLALLTVLMTGSAAMAGEIIVDATEVGAAMQRGAILWDVRGAEAYAQGHIAGAVNIGEDAAVLRNPNTEDYLPTARARSTSARPRRCCAIPTRRTSCRLGGCRNC